MADYFKAAFTLLAVINPIICGVMLLKIEEGMSKKDQILAAAKSSLAVLIILILAALMGKYILNIFGISVNVFQIVGGIIISYIGFSMFSPRTKSPDDKPKDEETLSTIVMFAASPGTIATVITFSAVHDKVGFPIITMGGVILAIILTWMVMLIMIFTSGHIKNEGQQIVTRLMGLILIAMGLQFMLSGLKIFFGE